MRKRYLLCYDVSNEERLRRTAKVAEAFGYRLQYSVFICDLSDVERIRLERDLHRVLNLNDDRALLVDLGPSGDSSAKRFHWVTQARSASELGGATIV